MRQYYEATEITEFEGDYIRADITGMTELEKNAVLTTIMDIMDGLQYTISEHNCYHDEGKPCPTLTVILEVV